MALLGRMFKAAGRAAGREVKRTIRRQVRKAGRSVRKSLSLQQPKPSTRRRPRKRLPRRSVR